MVRCDELCYGAYDVIDLYYCVRCGIEPCGCVVKYNKSLDD